LSSVWSHAAQTDKIIPPKSPSAQHGGSFQVLATSFQQNPKWTRKENVKTSPACGLELKDRDKSGTVLSPAFELSDGIDQIGTTWISDIPNNNLVVKIRLAKEKDNWGEWVIVNEQPRNETKAMVGRSPDGGRGIKSFETKAVVGKGLDDVPGFKYVQYSLDLHGPISGNSGCFRNIVLVGTNKALIDRLKETHGN
jgi:hypothetical protein